MQWSPTAQEAAHPSSSSTDPRVLLPDGVAPTAEQARLAVQAYLQAWRQHRQQLVPAGCAPDAVKLFIGNVPKFYFEDTLEPIFAQLGRVVELSVVRTPACAGEQGSCLYLIDSASALKYLKPRQFCSCVVFQRPKARPRSLSIPLSAAANNSKSHVTAGVDI